jgi:signal transduction histidine kinase/ActR/RegA family two-component response regulator
MRQSISSVKKTSYIGFSLIILLFLLLGVFSITKISSIKNISTTIFNHPLKVSNASLNARINTLAMHRSMKDVVLADNVNSIEQSYSLVNEEEKKVLRHLDVVKTNILGVEGKALEAETRALFLTWRPIREEVLELVKNNEIKKAANITKGKGADHEILLGRKITALTTYAQNKADGFIEQSFQIQKQSFLLIYVLVAIGTCLSFVIAFFTSKQILSAFSLRQEAEKEKLQLTDALQQSQKMEAIGTLAGGIAHDFNNMLGAIIGYAEFVKKEIPKESRAIEDIEQIILAAGRASDLVAQILTFSRKSQDKKCLVQPASIVKEALKLLHSTIPASIVIEEQIDSDCGTIFANATNIHQIVLNLCTNARHAMSKDKGVLRVELHCKGHKAFETPQGKKISRGSFIVLSVIDNGCGIDEEHIDRIFDPYFTTKKIGKGTGLGLSVVQGIVADCGGFIEVESCEGEGSTFSLYFPVVEDPLLLTDHSKNENMKIGIQGKANIMLIDDDPLLVTINKRRLENQGYSVTGISDSDKALDILLSQSHEFDLIITDQTMPSYTGEELASAVLEVEPSKPIILCTGHSDSFSKEKALSMGIKKYIYKPILDDELLNAVNEVLNEVN